MTTRLSSVQCNLVQSKFTGVHLDLNLLTVLEALVEEGSVGGAAHRLRLSSPAVSRSLGRIRRLTGDEILVRTGRTMTRTPYAVTVRGAIGDLLRQADRMLTPAGELDLSTLDRVFTVRAHDALAGAISPALVTDVLASAPGVQLRFMAEGASDTDELRHGVVDLELGSHRPTAPELRHEVLGADPLVALLRRGHPALTGRGELDLDSYSQLPHVIVSRRGHLVDPVDRVLETHQRRRLVIASVGTVAVAARIVADTDAVLTAPNRITGTVARAFDLATAAVPLSLPAPEVIAVWHQRSDSDPAHRWLRERVRVSVGTTLASARG